MLLILSSLALAGPCDLNLTVELLSTGTPVQGADAILYPQGRPALSDTELACEGSCSDAMDYDWKALQAALQVVEDSCPNSQRVTVVAREDTPYGVLIAGVRAAEAILPKVMIGGTVAVGSGSPKARSVTLTAGAMKLDDVPVQTLDFGQGEQSELHVEAPSDMPFSELRPVLRAASEAGYERFALARADGQVVAHAQASVGGEMAKVVRASLSSAQVQVGVVAIQGQLGECYDAALARDPTSGGTGKVGFTIEADGQVSSTSMVEGGFKDAQLQTCVLEAFAAAKFDAPGGQLKGSYPLTLALQ